MDCDRRRQRVPLWSRIRCCGKLFGEQTGPVELATKCTLRHRRRHPGREVGQRGLVIGGAPLQHLQPATTPDRRRGEVDRGEDFQGGPGARRLTRRSVSPPVFVGGTERLGVTPRPPRSGIAVTRHQNRLPHVTVPRSGAVTA